MPKTIADELAALDQMPASALKRRYAELFGEPTRTWNRAWLTKRIAWRLQVEAEGDLSDRARRRAQELANDADLRLSPPLSASKHSPARRSSGITQRDPRLPAVGQVLVRRYKGQTVEVRILAQGFEFAGVMYPTLSAVAKAITGSHVNGFHFFRLGVSS
jgi:hypothetical protein